MYTILSPEKPTITPNDFYKYNIYTSTVIAVTNWIIDTERLFYALPITPYVVQPKRRGRKPKNYSSPNVHVKKGSIITIFYDGKVRGVELKKRERNFRNSMEVVMILDKPITLKIPKNGKFQITGCLNIEHAVKVVEYIYLYSQRVKDQVEFVYSEENGETKVDVRELPPIITHKGDKPYAVFNTVLNNITFSIGYKINRECLDAYLVDHTEFNSLSEPASGYAGVVSQVSFKIPKDHSLPKIAFEDGKWKRNNISYKKYLDCLTQADKVEEEKKDYHITFLTFQTGKIIQTGPIYKEMEKYFHRFVSLLLDKRSIFEEVILPPPLDDLPSDEKDKNILGSGIYGVVRLIDGMACKILPKSFDPSVIRELDVFHRIKSKYIIPLQKLEMTDDEIRIYMPLARCDLGNLAENLPVLVRSSIFPEIFQGVITCVYALNSTGVCHRDIKPNNFLIFTEDGPLDKAITKPFSIQLCDFSVSMEKKRTGGLAYADFFRSPILDSEDVICESSEIYACAATLISFLMGRSIQPSKYEALIKRLKITKPYKTMLTKMLNNEIGYKDILASLPAIEQPTIIKPHIPNVECKLDLNISQLISALNIDDYVLTLTEQLVKRLSSNDTITMYACFCIASLYYDFEIPEKAIMKICKISCMSVIDDRCMDILHELGYIVIV